MIPLLCPACAHPLPESARTAKRETYVCQGKGCGLLKVRMRTDPITCVVTCHTRLGNQPEISAACTCTGACYDTTGRRLTPRPCVDCLARLVRRLAEIAQRELERGAVTREPPS